jgi:epoxyqueuosine reductase
VKRAIQQRARELGFDLCRVTTAQPPATGRRFQQWLAAGRHGEMAYLARQAAKRLDPQLVLPGARSIIVLAVSYATEGGGRQEPAVSGHADAQPHITPPLPKHRSAGLQPAYGALSSRDSPIRRPTVPGQDCGVAGDSFAQSRLEAGAPAHEPRGAVAGYACFTDYHAVLGERLRALIDFVNGLGGPATRSLWYVDTGPLLERDLAQRAGVGFIGKHTNLISRQLGNWFFLGEILTTLELAPDAAERNHCGNCERCLAACPTGALVAPGQLDARRCISYLTIEHKGPVPLALRPLLGNRVFGCDDCLAVCPWNRFARATGLMQPQARPQLAAPDLLALLSLDEAGFQQRFGGTPMARAKRRGLLRNVCVALGNVGNQSALPALARAASAPEPLIAEHARWAIAQIGRRSAECTA